MSTNIGDLQTEMLTLAEAKKRKANVVLQSRKQQKQLLQAEQPRVLLDYSKGIYQMVRCISLDRQFTYRFYSSAITSASLVAFTVVSISSSAINAVTSASILLRPIGMICSAT